MSLDGIAMRALAQDLKNKLLDGRIEKIAQPTPTSITMAIRANGKGQKLYSTISPQCARVTLTERSFKSPLTPPQFCMVLRKHLQGAVIEDIVQIGWERMISFKLRGRNEIGEQTQFNLLFELMGKNSNIMLLDKNDIILDAIRRVGANTNNYRQFQPGIPYQMPPAQDKISLENLNEELLSTSFFDIGLQKTAHKALLQTIAGLGPQTVNELLIRANIAADTRVEYLGEIDFHRLFLQCQNLLSQANKEEWMPSLVFNDEDDIIAFAPFELKQFPNFKQIQVQTLTELLENYYETKEIQEIFQQKKSSLDRIIRHERERCEKKLQLQLEKINELENAESYRINGELITANLYHLKQGAIAEVQNFYLENAPMVKIEMNPTKTPNENAQLFFKKYAKAKIGSEKAAVQADKTREELEYLASIYDSLEQSQNDADLIDIRLELEDSGYAKRRVQKQGKQGKHSPSPTHLVINGYDVYIGKNNHQNDYVTLKIGRNADLWLHTKDIHGAHVIVKANRNIDGFPSDVIEKAAMLAAWFSKAKFSAKVPVDYTLRKNVHKPSGAKPGMVIYTDQQTCYSTPLEQDIQQLLQQTGE